MKIAPRAAHGPPRGPQMPKMTKKTSNWKPKASKTVINYDFHKTTPGQDQIRASQEDILSAFKEMELLLDSRLNLDDEDIKLQKKFWKIFQKPYNNIDNFIISPSFLKKNSYLFS